jgi:hypothetical protein
MSSTNNVIIGVLSIILSAVVPVQAGFIQAVGATMSGDIQTVLPAGNLIIDATSTAYVQVSSDATPMWEGDTGNTTANPPKVLLTFDIGAKYDVSKLYVWAWNYPGSYQMQQRSVNGFDLYGSANGVDFTLIGAGFSSHYVGDTADQTVQSFDLTGATGVRYFRMDIKSNWLGGGSLITSYTPVGLGEVAFDGTPVPEPGMLAMAGACLVGLLCRGRRKRV